VVVEQHVADGARASPDGLDALNGGRGHVGRHHGHGARSGRSRVEDREGVAGSGSGWEQARIEDGDAGAVVGVHQVHTVDGQHRGTAPQVGRCGGGRRVRIGVGHQRLAGRPRRDQGPLRPVSCGDTRLRQRNPLWRRIGEVEFVLGVARRSGGRGLEQVEVIRGGVGGRIEIGRLAVPEVQLLRPRAEPVVLGSRGALHVRVGLAGGGVGAAARVCALCGEGARRCEGPGLPCRRGRASAAGAAPAPASGGGGQQQKRPNDAQERMSVFR